MKPTVDEKAQMTAVETHVQNFFDSIKSRQDPNCPVEVAAAPSPGRTSQTSPWTRSPARFFPPDMKS